MKNPSRRYGNWSEVLWLAVPFLGLLLAYGHLTGTIDFKPWPPQVEMNIRFWGPALYCTYIYGYVLYNCYSARKGNWKWYREGLLSLLAILVVGFLLWPIYEASVSRHERYKVGLHY